MSIQDSISKTKDVPDELIAHLNSCAESFWYFLKTEVKTVDPQEGIYERQIPDWDYIHRTADELQAHRRNAILKSRQLILTWIASAKVLWKALFQPPYLGLLLSKGGRYSRETGQRIEYIKNHLSFADMIEMKTNAQYNEYSFPGIANNKFQCLPADEDVVRTFSPSHIVLDEAAFFPYPGKIMDAIGPLLEANVDFDILSTPNGEDLIFHPIWHDKNSDIHKIELWWYDRPDRDEKWFEELQKRPGMTPDKIAREYLHSFAIPAGLPVYQNYNGKQAQKCFERYNPLKPVVRGFDRGFEAPAVLWTQVNDDDQLMALHEMRGDRVPRAKWLADVQMTTQALFPNHKGGFIDWGASDFHKPESDGVSWKEAMKAYGIHLRESKKDDIYRRTTAVRDRLRVRQDGKFGIIIDPDHCPELVAAMGGGYHYPDKPDHQGELKPVKDKYSHLADCLAHICDNHFDVMGGAKPELKTIRLGSARRNNNQPRTVWA